MKEVNRAAADCPICENLFPFDFKQGFKIHTSRSLTVSQKN